MTKDVSVDRFVLATRGSKPTEWMLWLCCSLFLITFLQEYSFKYRINEWQMEMKEKSFVQIKFLLFLKISIFLLLMWNESACKQARKMPTS